MDFKDIEKVRAYVKDRMDMDLHDRHLDDCVQYILLKKWEYLLEGKPHYKILYIFYTYLRENGLGKEPKAGAVALENAYEYEQLPTGPDERWDNRKDYRNDLFEEILQALRS